ncbi:CAP domain-containing protein [Roseovarius sp. S4756]|uniref:CAP domain-containing protein n=1 Tax=Roseovarius maritimus TaxID=3342637 RepID=UPI00372879F2
MPITQAEQYLVEMINRARLDPHAEAARYGLNDLNDDLSGNPISGNPLQPLAPDAQLHGAAQGHSEWMLANNLFSHTGAGGSSSTNRMVEAGYTLAGSWRTGENIAWTGTTGTLDLDSAIAQHHEGLFLSAGHRRNLLNDDFREIGISQVEGRFTTSSYTYNTSMLTENFAKSGSNVFLTGAVYEDSDNDDFFSIGEGRDGASFAIGNAQTQSLSAGGYTLEVTPGADKLVTVSYGSLNATVRIDLAQQNAKLDLVDGDMLLSSADLTLVNGVTKAGLLGAGDLDLFGSNAGDTLTGNKGDNLLHGQSGDDILEGRAGNDTLLGGGQNDLLRGSEGRDRLNGDGGFDTLEGGAGHDTLDGGNNADNLFGDVGNDRLMGGQGLDRLFGGSGNDTLEGDADADLLMGGTQEDSLFGDAGADRLYGEAGFDRLRGGDGDDMLDGGAQADNLFGESGDDLLMGGHGFDRLFGDLGNDVLHGGANNDALRGGAGFDTIHGGDGDDLLQGDFNADTFVFADGFGNDMIVDFDALNRFEKIDLHGVTNIVDYADLRGNHMTQSGSDVLITVGNDRLTLSRVDMGNLGMDDFLF